MPIDANILTRLVGTLNQAKIQNTNPALYQCIHTLIQAAQQQVSAVSSDVTALDTAITNGTKGGIQELTGDVTAGPGSGTQAATIANNAVSNAKLRDSGALSVIGRSANSTGDPADISATAATDAVLRESGSTVGFGTIATGGIANKAITNAKLRDSVGKSVIGYAGITGGTPADIPAGTDQVLLERLGAIGWATITTPNVTSHSLTYAALDNIGTQLIVGRNTAGTGTMESITITQALAWLTTSSWTPVLKFGGGNTGMTFSGTTGKYLQHGNLAIISGSFTLSAKGSSTGNAVLTLPLTSLTGCQQGLGVQYYDNMAAGVTGAIGGLIQSASTSYLMYKTGGAGSMTALTDADFTNTSSMIYSFAILVP